ncbi:MAG: nickel pincer cofactor biosynthesis protein LarB [Elusimicrobia bacterium]|nr:nickel pincer cofactor biosynthesis protein LarB [Elusimicrobiota bacterium]
MKCDFMLDTERFHRQGFPEAVYSLGKTEEQIVKIINKLVKSRNPLIVTKIEKKLALKIKKKFAKNNLKYYEKAKILAVNPVKISGNGYIAVITAGTSDVSVAEESAVVAELLGNRVERIYDVGVAGIHRLFKHEKIIIEASCVVVCAGMEGALSSVVGGLVSKVVIGVPTSTGYGTGKGGYSALLTMLNSCSPNVCVVNIDNGFGAGIIANIINKMRNC